MEALKHNSATNEQPMQKVTCMSGGIFTMSKNVTREITNMSFVYDESFTKAIATFWALFNVIESSALYLS